MEVGVLIAKRWILALLRHRTFYSLAELNGAIVQLFQRLNSRLLRKLQNNRASENCLNASILPNALSLPDKPYQYANGNWPPSTSTTTSKSTNIFYSVPYKLIHDKLDVPADRPYRRSFPKKASGWPPTCDPSLLTIHTTLKEHHPARPSELSGVDSFADHRLGQKDRPRYRWSKRSSIAVLTPSRLTAPAWAYFAWRNTIPKSAGERCGQGGSVRHPMV